MLKTFRFLLALAVALMLMLVFRALAFTICTVEGNGLEPVLQQGDRVLVNRWSYGLRVGSEGGLFGYGRLGRRPVSRGDLVAFENPHNTDEVLICRCKALPGDTISTADGQTMVVPSLKTCNDADHYWMEALGTEDVTDSRYWGFVPEDHIVGKPIFIWWSSDPDRGLFSGGIRWSRLFRFVDNIK